SHIICFPLLFRDELLFEKIASILNKCFYNSSVLFVDATKDGIDISNTSFSKYIKIDNVIFEHVDIDLYPDIIIACLDIALRRFPGNDFLFINPGIKVPDMWDIRLKKAAYFDSYIATSSPMCDASPFFSLVASDCQDLKLQYDCDEIDRLAFCLGHRFIYETPCFFYDVFYMRFDALEEICDYNTLVKPGTDLTISSLNNLLNSVGKLHVLCDHIYVSYNKRYLMSYNSNLDYHKCNSGVNEFLLSHPLTSLRQGVAQFIDKQYKVTSMPGLESKPVILHITHSWGGGIEKWLEDFSAANDKATNIVLKSVGNSNNYGYRLALFTGIKDSHPIRTWELSFPISCSRVSNIEYKRIFDQIIKEFSVDAVIVSSLIGHSFDSISSNKKTIIVCHDYYPFCPAATTYFNMVCAECDINSLSRCIAHNQSNLLMNDMAFSAREWLNLRAMYVKLIKSHGIGLVAPSNSSVMHLCALEPHFSPSNFTIIPHGYPIMRSLAAAKYGDQLHLQPRSKMCAVVLGQLKNEKGLCLLKEVCHELSKYVDIYLVGCGEEAKQAFNGDGCIKDIIERYDRSDLPEIIGSIAPDFGLLLSVCPETFSYTLSELMILGVPPVATALGAFKDRITDKVNGFLFEPRGDALLEIVQMLAENPEMLIGVRERLRSFRHRSLDEMVDDYMHILKLAEPPAARYELCIGTETGLTEPYMRLYAAYRDMERAYARTKEAYEQRTQAYEQVQGRITELNALLRDAAAESENARKKLDAIYGTLYWRIGHSLGLIRSD
ncbi:MAG: glycosyltransferase family 4 protein, partial [Dissulfurimicrobium sp.]|uniref:glycosyltransferase family 4 protein n=1 Tax=Dissulfurimicrobium sp. TaxID=2022436 RepID=UPI00404A5D80